jgi:hypothetical protein
MVMGASPRTAVQPPPNWTRVPLEPHCKTAVHRACLRAQIHRLSSLSVRVSVLARARACVRACARACVRAFECACIGSAAGRGGAQIGLQWSLCFGIRTDRFVALDCHT